MTHSNRCPDPLQADPLRASHGRCAEASHARDEAACRSGIVVSIAVHRFVNRSRTGRGPGGSARDRCGIAFAVALALLCAPNAGRAKTPIAEEGIDSSAPAPRTGVGWRVRGGVIHSLDADLDAGGAFDTTRAVLEGSVRYAFGATRFVGLSVGYGWDGYDFSPAAQIGGQPSWDEVHTLRSSMPIIWAFGIPPTDARPTQMGRHAILFKKVLLIFNS